MKLKIFFSNVKLIMNSILIRHIKLPNQAFDKYDINHL